MAAFHLTRSLIDSIAARNPIFGDVRDIGQAADLLEVLWWRSEDAGQQMVWRARPESDPAGATLSRRYRILFPLWHLRREPGDPALAEETLLPDRDLSMDAGPPPPPDSPFVYSGARIQFDGAHFPGIGKTAEEISISRVARPPDGSPALGNAADTLRAAAIYDAAPTSASPLDQPPGTVVLYAVTQASGRWSNATNVVVRFTPIVAGMPGPREVSIIRGCRPYNHAAPVGYEMK
jgi:hypothetical protein